MAIKKKWITYSNLMTLLNITEEELDTYGNNLKFEIKLYLLGLSFNRFIFNFDKIIFTLCIVSNFLFFLSIAKPRVLFLGAYLYCEIIEFASSDCNQFYFREYLLPGTLAGVAQSEKFYKTKGKEIFVKHIDCIISFFSIPNSQVLKEASRLNIPIVGLIEIDAPRIFPIDFPVIAINDLDNNYFFANYFSKILNSKNLKKKYLVRTFLHHLLINWLGILILQIKVICFYFKNLYIIIRLINYYLCLILLYPVYR